MPGALKSYKLESNFIFCMSKSITYISRTVLRNLLVFGGFTFAVTLPVSVTTRPER